MPTPWVILGRVVHEEHAGAAADFTLAVAPPPRFTVLSAGRRAHPVPNRPDPRPYIVAAAPNCLVLAHHFSVAPSVGMSFEDNPRDSLPHPPPGRSFDAAGSRCSFIYSAIQLLGTHRIWLDSFEYLCFAITYS
ncbi:unnamed protein product [Urochloa humidicola]